MAAHVYLSDTSSELRDLRPILIEQIRAAGMAPLWLEDEERGRRDLLDIAQRKIQQADYFISIVTYRRGWEPEANGNRSLAEIECDLAGQLGKPLMVLLPNPSSPMAMDLRQRALSQDESDREAQRRFWERLEQAGVVSYFTDEADLTRQIVDTLDRWSLTAAPTGLTSAGAVPAMPMPQPTPLAPIPAAPPAELERQGPARDGGLRLNPADVDLLADRVADKTASRVQEVQQRQQQDLAKKALRVNEALRVWPGELVFGRPASGSQFRSDIFMIMPFAQQFNPVYSDVVRPVARELNLTIRRGDEFTSTRGDIMEEVWAAINACRFVIADITGGNDNVFYELGIAHTLNKPALLITQARKPDEVPFDIRHLRYTPYENTAAGYLKLRDDLRAAINRLLVDLREGWGKE